MELFLVGIISGIVTGLGMGGGSILILILVTFMNVSQHMAQAINILYFIPTSIIAIIIHAKNDNVDKQVAKKLLIPCVLGSAIGAYLTTMIKSEGLKKYFGFFLLAVRHIRNNYNYKRTYERKEECEMKNLVTGMIFGAVIGGVIGTMASDEIYDIKNMIVKKSKKFAKKCNWM